MAAQTIKTEIVNDLLVVSAGGSNPSGMAGAGTMTSRWLDMLEMHMCSFNIAWTNVAATAGTISFEGTNDPAQASTSIVTLTPTVILGNGGVLTTIAAASVVIVNFSELPRFVRYKNVQTAGGAVGQFSGWFIAKSA